MKDHQDAFGHAMIDHFEGRGGLEIVERDDGYFDVGGGPELYFSPYEEWMPHEKKAMEYVRGRVLDIGCGAGRHVLYLQGRGFDVMGIDNSPLAVEVCRRRGVKNVEVLSINAISSRLGLFDTILMFGNNFGLFENPQKAKMLLGKFHKMTSEEGRIIAIVVDPYKTKIPEHLEYHRRNRDRGRMPGQLRLRVRYKRYVTPWFDYLFVSRDELEEILAGTGWRVTKFIDSKGFSYVAIMEKEVIDDPV